jgi:hypothetical protein
MPRAPGDRFGNEGAMGAMGSVETLIPAFDNLSARISELVSLGPNLLLGDETVHQLTTFSDNFLTGPVQAFTLQVDRLSQVLATNIQLQIVPPTQPIQMNVELGGMTTIMNKLQGIITQEIFQATIDKLQAQIDNLTSPMDTDSL